MCKKYILVFLLVMLSQPGIGKTIEIALVRDGSAELSMQLQQYFITEIDALMASEFQLEYVEFAGDYSVTGISEAFEAAYQNRQIDLVIAADVIGSQLMVQRNTYPKPTFLPFVFGGSLVNLPMQGNQSGKHNLNYLTDDSDFIGEVNGFLQILPFKHLALVGDSSIFESFDGLDQWKQNIYEQTGVQLHRYPLTGQEDMNELTFSPEIQAVAAGGLRQLTDGKKEQLINRINALKLPSFGLLGREQVEAGMLATNAFDQDWQRLARQTALNVQAVALGESASEQPVLFKAKRSIIINMATAREIGYSPRFDVLGEATLINEVDLNNSRQYTLIEVAKMALSNNLDQQIANINPVTAEYDADQARAAFLPQVTVNGTHLQVKKTANVEAGLQAERSLDASLGLEQLIYSDDRSTAHHNARLAQEIAQLGTEDTRLETIRSSTTTYLNVLRAEAQLLIQKENLKVTKTNLDLAQNRVDLGSSSAADLYRWESQLSTVRSNLIATQNQLKQAKESLNQLLNRPLDEGFVLEQPNRESLLLFSENQFNDLIYNQALFDRFMQVALQTGIDNSPAMQQLALQIKIKEREIKNHKRAYWLPDFALRGQYDDNLEQSGLGVNSGQYANNWNVAVTASLPLFQGGLRRAALGKAEAELEQLHLQHLVTEQKLEQSIKAAFHNAFASYQNVELFEMSAVSAEKNLDLVTDSYAKGVVSIIELLDAQNSTIQAQVAASNAVYDFLIDILNLERTTSRYIFLLSPAERAEQRQRLIQSLSEQPNS